MRLSLALLLIGGGLVLWLASQRERASVPPWMPRLALALGALGVSTLAATRPGVSWSISSICFSVIAIVLIATVLRDILRR